MTACFLSRRLGRRRRNSCTHRSMRLDIYYMTRVAWRVRVCAWKFSGEFFRESRWEYKRGGEVTWESKVRFSFCCAGLDAQNIGI